MYSQRFPSRFSTELGQFSNISSQACSPRFCVDSETLIVVIIVACVAVQSSLAAPLGWSLSDTAIADKEPGLVRKA